MEKQNSITSKKMNPKSIFLDIIKSTPGAVFITTLLMTGLIEIFTGNFYSIYNISTLVRQMSFMSLVAFGQTLVLIIGGIDLSVASIAILSSMSLALLSTTTSINPFLAIIIALLIGALAGLFNALIICKVGVNPFIVTLASSSIFTGIVVVVTGGSPITGLPTEITTIGKSFLFGVPVPAIIMLLVCIIITIILKYTSFGRDLYAVGGNEEASQIMGILTDKTKMIVYSLSGLLSASGGILITLRLASSHVRVGSGWLLPSITAAIIGGTTLSGGQGTVIGTLTGAFLMAVISRSITLVGIASEWETIVTGGVVLIAVTIDVLRNKK